eukprot:CAMPEP_0171137680 /NCGR_PEP_ID=MMETSP0766_2-20121228/133756_1 /TAXON_ID=439317 /ORGANISM="Gambierdiscus australes, Strain CAWD 149" /LENGTH=188 /DNA_ID=CAMNT_0011601267 /DNA_START=200 /DNA_END=767 /DNA_ORIENTATION=+
MGGLLSKRLANPTAVPADPLSSEGRCHRRRHGYECAHSLKDAHGKEKASALFGVRREVGRQSEVRNGHASVREEVQDVHAPVPVGHEISIAVGGAHEQEEKDGIGECAKKQEGATTAKSGPHGVGDVRHQRVRHNVQRPSDGSEEGDSCQRRAKGLIVYVPKAENIATKGKNPMLGAQNTSLDKIEIF